MRRWTFVSFALLLALLAPAQAQAFEFLRTWGRDVIQSGAPGDTGTGFEICTVAAHCKGVGLGSTLGGEMSSPIGVATDGAGSVYVADRDNNRIQKFDSQGNFLRAWGEDVVNTGPGNTGGFEICVAANGDTCKSGDTGGGGGEFNFIFGVASDVAGNVYVTDRNNHRIQKFDSQGNFLRAWGEDVVSSGEHETAADAFEICVNAAGSNPDDVCKAGVNTTPAPGGELSFPSGVAADATGNVYVVDTSHQRIQRFDSQGGFQRAWGRNVHTSAATEPEICVVAANCQAGASGGLGGEFNFPSGVAADATGIVYVADERNHRIQKFDPQGNFLRAWGKDVVNDAAMNTGFEVCIEAPGCKAGSNATELGGELDHPFGVGIDGGRNVHVADGDGDNNRVQTFDAQGNFLRAWGKDVISGNAEMGFEICAVAATCKRGETGGLGGELNAPLGVAGDAAGNTYVADLFNNRIQKLGEPAVTAATPPVPSNRFTLVSHVVKGRVLKLVVEVAGVVQVRDASAAAGGRARAAAKAPLLKTSTAGGGPGQLEVKLKLTRAGKRKLRAAGKLKVSAAITFTPTGGTASSQVMALKIKR